MKTKLHISKKIIASIVAVISFAALSLQANAQVLCQAGFTATANTNTVTFTNTSTGGTTPSYNWSFGDSNYDWQVNPVHVYMNNGTYLVCMTMYDSLNTCQSTFCDSVTITNAPNPPLCNLSIITSGTNPSGPNVNDGSVTVSVSNGTAPYNYLWNMGNTTATVASLGNGCYVVTIADANGCSGSASICINDSVSNPALCVILSVSSTNPSSSTTNDGSVSVSVSGGVAPYVYHWTPGNYATATVTGLGNGCYVVQVTDANGCADSTSVCISDSANNVGCSAGIYLYPDSTNPLKWYIYPSVSGTAPFTYFWDFGDGNTSTQFYPMHTYANAGTYIICLTITDATQCTSSTCDSTYKVTTTGTIQELVVLDPNALGIEENTISVNSIFPNPSSDVLEVTLSKSIQGEIRITDITGREVFKQNINSNTAKINVSSLPVGCYTLSIVSGNKMSHNQIMIAR